MFLSLFRKRRFSFKILTSLVLINFAVLITIKMIGREEPCEPPEAISCHHTVIDDDLEYFDGFSIGKNEESSNNGVRSIFFHETSCKGDLSPRQACSVESAARAHPSWDIHVLFSAPVPRGRSTTGGTGMATLKGLANVKFWRLNIQKFVKETPLEGVDISRNLSSSCFPTVHTADLLRILTLYKHPGVCLDLEVIVTKPLAPLGNNYVVRESDHAVSLGVLAFSGDSIGRSVALEAVNEFAVSFKDTVVALTGPALMLRVLQRRCHTEKPVNMNNFSCQGLSVYGQEIAYPVHCSNKSRYLDTSAEIPGAYHTHIHHLWSHLTHRWAIPTGSVYHRLAVKHCPQVYWSNTTLFGGTS